MIGFVALIHKQGIDWKRRLKLLPEVNASESGDTVNLPICFVGNRRSEAAPFASKQQHGALKLRIRAPNGAKKQCSSNSFFQTLRFFQPKMTGPILVREPNRQDLCLSRIFGFLRTSSNKLRLHLSLACGKTLQAWQAATKKIWH